MVSRSSFPMKKAVTFDLLAPNGITHKDNVGILETVRN